MAEALATNTTLRILRWVKRRQRLLLPGSHWHCELTAACGIPSDAADALTPLAWLAFALRWRAQPKWQWDW